ncbi:Ulp1 protease family C-terminal catalytic domain [Arabidopsis thaliana x Arabidopsis arenosa]|uniref:Ulp1 protease family C-terminal catalytic domain n=1 Tax=Arabidopsis thaliana x Arabidopsis arenosa TaxID=1240361 RepID=A0A8T1ZJK4_9BRAS|nr:Ulp1 protease family C-terminal catalytic domain [Arabidopsis thaliana x Arabidopsis arenosa]
MGDIDLPSRLFADREEPNGDRVNQYFKLYAIKVVLKALQPSELEIIRPCFGKLLDAYSKPTFSGKLAHFLLTRQLNVNKRHEIWVIFAGKPVRFSLREFGLVTGLDCSPLPTLDRALLKAPPGVTPYWFTLFGGEDCFTGEMLLAKLRRPKSLTSDLRVKYACLLLVDGLLCRRSYHMKIPKAHCEMIRDLDVFLKYPWGRYSFDMTMRCIKSRSIIQLAQQTVAIQGFIHALVLVLIESVPAVGSAVGEATDPESGDEDEHPVISLKLDKVWDLDGEKQVVVHSVLPSDADVPCVSDCSWPDEVTDPSVEVMLQKIEEGVSFSRGMFAGGVRASEVQVEPPPRVVARGKRKVRSRQSAGGMSRGESSRSKKQRVRTGRSKSTLPESNGVSDDYISTIAESMKKVQIDLYAHLCVEIKSMELRLERSMQATVATTVSDAISSRDVVDKVLRSIGVGYSQPNVPTDAPMPGFTPQANPLPQNAPPPTQTDGSQGNGSSVGSDERSTSQSPDADPVEVPLVASDAKFLKLSQTILPTMTFAFPDSGVLSHSELLSIPNCIPPDNTRIMDACVSSLRESLADNSNIAAASRADILPSTFHGSLAPMYAKFKKCRRKETFEFDAALLRSVAARSSATGRTWLADIHFLYSPFNIDRNRWIAVMIDLSAHCLTVFDSTANVRRGSRLKPELEFICEMFPYLVRQVGANEVMKNFPLQPLVFTRNTHVAQASTLGSSGVLSLLFMEAHALGGLEEVSKMSEFGARSRAERLVVEMYEHCCGDIELE